MNEIKAKRVLGELIKQSKSNLTTDGLFSVFKNKYAKYNTKKYVQLLQQLCKQVPNANKHIANFSNAADNKKDPYQCLLVLLNDIENDRQAASQPQIQLMVPEKPMTEKKVEEKTTLTPIFENPTPSSTRINENFNTPCNTVNEIKEKIALATSSGLRLSTGMTSTPVNAAPSQKPPAESTTNNLWNFNFDEIVPLQNTRSTVAIPAASQELVVIKELLYCLIGIPGSLITVKPPTISTTVLEFKVSDQLQESLRDMIMEILPLANYYWQIQTFIEEKSTMESGQVLQALGAAVRGIMNDYLLSITQLETLYNRKKLNLHKLLYFLRPIMHTMELLAQTLISISILYTRGGKVLTYLHDRITTLSGDTSTQKIFLHLNQLAAVPYMEILQLWILKGVIWDPQHEFLVEDTKLEPRSDLPDTQAYTDDYWEKRYIICPDKIPRFLENQADIILRTGKYLNVIRECGKNITQAPTETLKFSHTDHNYVQFINTAYNFASESLLKLFMNENDLLGRLLSVKRYFLLEQGDFIIQFMDACEQELSKKVDEVLPMRLENLLEITLRLSSAKHDKYQDDLRTMLLPYGIVTQMSKIINKDDAFLDIDDTSELKGIECFTFGYDVQWPVSIVLNQIAISKYQMIFRQLYYCKHVEIVLCRVWTANNDAKKFPKHTAQLYRSAFALRQRMMSAIQNFEYYMMIEVIEPNWHTFIQNMDRVKNIDEVLAYHQDFLDLCLKNCMLTDPDLLKSIIHLCNICIEFCEFIGSESSLAPSDTFSQKVKRFDSDFTGNLLELLKKMNDVASQNPSDKFINLIHRINFNSYYSDKLDFLCQSVNETL